MVMVEGFEPSTYSLEGCCSIQLSYTTMHAILIRKERDFNGKSLVGEKRPNYRRHRRRE